MNKFRPPEPLQFEGNLSEQWDRWKQQFQLYLTATESDDKEENIKTSIFLTCIGKQGLEIYNTFNFTDDTDKMKLKPVMTQFEAYCKPRKNITMIRHHFFTHRQQDGVSFDTFVTELKKRSSQCEFKDLRDSLIRDMIVIGVSDNHLRERLLRVDKLSLEEAIKLGQAAEVTRQQAHELCKSQTGSHNAIDALRIQSNPNRGGSRQTNHIGQAPQPTPCKYCGTQHRRGKCPAYGKTCTKCSKLNHYASVCLSNPRNVHFAEMQDEAKNDEFFIGTVTQENLTIDALESPDNELDWLVPLESNGAVISYKIDTGAQANILPFYLLESLPVTPTLEETQVRLSAYNGS